jgi:P-type Cu2+ transporter
VTCCDGIAEASARLASAGLAETSLREELRAGGRATAGGGRECVFSVPAIRCGQCIATIERTLSRCEGVTAARVNLTLRRVSIIFEADADPLPALRCLEGLGYPATLLDPGAPEDDEGAREASGLLRAVAVAGFGAMNIMLMSVAVWAGADGGMRALFHLLSGLIAVPVVVYAGRPFFASAWGALRSGRLNMDVPISLGVLLAMALSLFETMRGGEEVFFDAAVTLLFFLLIGRYLDRLMRERARSAVTGLARLAAKGAMRLGADGAPDYVPLAEIRPGMVLRVPAGERIPVDVRVVGGTTDLDRSIVTGESAPVAAGPGDELEAGALNLTGTVDALVLRPAETSFLAEVMQMFQAAERGRGRYVRIADRAARLYAPVVHLLAAATFLGWMAATGGDWHAAVFTAVSVLIITCPCALGLAVPAVHVVGAGRLFRAGIMVKDGSALERLAEADRVVFDKTGTVTTGAPVVTGDTLAGPADRAAAKALALHSAHPASRAIGAYLAGGTAALGEVRELPGKGVEARVSGRRARLGRPDWVAAIAAGETPTEESGPAFAVEGRPVAGFTLSETLRPGARATVEGLRQAGLGVELLSGDGPRPVARIAGALGVDDWRAGCTPAGKVAHLEALRRQRARALMVGDGLNDTAALAAAHVSMAPASASDAGRLAADFVFTRERLDAVLTAHAVARRAASLVRQNFGLTIAYNCIAVPLAVAGLVTPLVAAVAMSASSILVVANALRLNERAPRSVGLGGGQRAEGAFA